MAVNTVQGPAWDEVKTAYNDIIFDVFASTSSEVVYCDIYFDTKYYKTLVSTSPIYGFGSTQHRFNISDAAREYAKTAHVYPATHTTMQFGYGDGLNVTQCYCKFRGSTISANNVITPDAPVPIQGTMDNVPVAGGGAQSNLFYIVDAALQAENNSSLLVHLAAYRSNPVLIGPFYIDTNIFKLYPLSHASAIRLKMNDYAQFPFLLPMNSCNGRPWANVTLQVLAVLPNGTGASYNTGFGPMTINHIKRYYIPIGVPQLLALNPAIPFSTFQYYFVYIYSNTDGAVMFATPKIIPEKACTDRVRIWFRNNLGSFDQLNFGSKEERLTVVSGGKTMTNGFAGRFNTQLRTNSRSNELITAVGTFTEAEMPVVKELLASSLSYVEKYYDDNGSLLNLFPIRIHDSEIVTLKFEDRYEYEVTIEYSMAVTNIHVNQAHQV